MAEVTYRVRRFDPEKDSAPHWEDYRIEATTGMTVLDGLLKIKETRSPTLVWRSSCRMGICGSCGMLVNGRACLACNTQIADLGTEVVTVAPLPNFATIRDLVPDLTPKTTTVCHVEGIDLLFPVGRDRAFPATGESVVTQGKAVMPKERDDLLFEQ